MADQTFLGNSVGSLWRGYLTANISEPRVTRRDSSVGSPLYYEYDINNFGLDQYSADGYNIQLDTDSGNYKFTISTNLGELYPYSKQSSSRASLTSISENCAVDGGMYGGKTPYYYGAFYESLRYVFYDLQIPITREAQSLTLTIVQTWPACRKYNAQTGKYIGNKIASGTSTLNVNINVPEAGTKTLTFVGGEGVSNVPEPLTVNLLDDYVIPDTIPTKPGYKFIGWGYSPASKNPSYYPGQTLPYITWHNRASSIYALFVYGYGVSLNSILSKRWGSTKAEGAKDEGKYGFVTGSYTLTGGLQNTGTLTAKYKKSSDATWTNVPSSLISPATATKSENEDAKTVNFEIGPFGGDVDTDSTYDVQITVTDTGGNESSLNDYLSTAFFTIDIRNGGKEIAFGTPANDNDVPSNGRFKCGMEAVFVNSSLAFKNVFSLFYPVGSVYETSLPNAIPSGETTPTDEDLANLGVTWFDPHYQWGGTWELVQDRFLVGAGNLYAVDAEGGSKDAVVVSHHHTTNTYHRHNLVGSKYGSNYCASGNRSGVGANSDANTTLYTNYAGSQTAASTTVGEDGTDKNMPPYKAVYIWHRTA